MNAAAYRLVIRTADPGEGFRYRVSLFSVAGGRVANTYTSTRIGARIWARRVARKHKRANPWQTEERFDV